MANEQNLRPYKKGQLSSEEAKRRGSLGGKKSVEAKRERRAMQELAKIILDLPIKEGDIEDASFLSDVIKTDEKGNAVIGENGKPIPKNFTVAQAALMAQAQKAVKGDPQALAFLRDTAGEKPIDKVEVNGDLKQASEDIGAMIEDLKAKDNEQ